MFSRQLSCKTKITPARRELLGVLRHTLSSAKALLAFLLIHPSSNFPNENEWGFFFMAFVIIWDYITQILVLNCFEVTVDSHAAGRKNTEIPCTRVSVSPNNNILQNHSTYKQNDLIRPTDVQISYFSCVHVCMCDFSTSVGFCVCDHSQHADNYH